MFGFWEEYEELKKDYPDASWEFLENQGFVYHTTTYDFLHGVCYVFAQYLHNTYGYEIHGFYEEPDQMIHAYCTVNIDDNTYYIDIRGITDSWDEFIEEFYDTGMWCGDYDYSYYLERTDVVKPDMAEDMKFWDEYKAAKFFDDKYGYYDISKIMKKVA